MNILSLGRRRLKIEFRLEHVEPSPAAVAERHANLKVRDAALAERQALELDHLSRTVWIH